MKRFAIFAMIFALAACEVEERPSRWSDELDPYMAKHGYTLNDSTYVIYKNDYPVWKDEPCWGRGCFNHNSPLVPYELAEGVRVDLLAALKEAREEYVADISATIGVEPIVREKKE